jgi:hypothetical protein
MSQNRDSLSICGTSTEYRRQFDLMPGGREFLVLVPMGP